MNRTRKVLFQYGYQARRSLGQHFLVDEGLLRKISELADLSKEDWVLEIGSGPGNLTRYLLERAGKVMAMEIEPELVKILKSQLQSEKLEVLEEDILRFDLNQIKGEKKLKVVANLPYNISTEVIFRLLEAPGIFSELYLMLQREVAERVVAKPGTKDYGILAVISQFHSEPEILLRLGPGAFHPRPRVDSALVKFKVFDLPRYELANYLDFKKLIRAMFGKRRKTLRNALSKSGLGLDKSQAEELLKKAGISPQARAEQIELERLVLLSNLYSQKKKDAGAG